MKVSWKRWETILGKQPSRWQKPLHGNLNVKVGKHSFNLTLAPHVEYWKVHYSHSVKIGDKWEHKTSKNYF